MTLRKEVNIMEYTKPTITVIGDAVTVIQNQTKPGSNGDPLNSPAYDLDE